MSKNNKNVGIKVVPFYPNESDNLHCLQASIRSILDYFKIDCDKDKVDENTGFFGTMSWLPHSVNWLSEVGLDVKLYSICEYDKLIDSGEEYLKTLKGQFFDKEKNEGQYKYLDKVIEASKQMIDKKLWINKQMSIEELKINLDNEKTLAIAKTIYEFLDGRAIAGNPHFVTVIKEYRPGEWLIHDPGLPGVERRKVSQIIEGGVKIFGDIVLISEKSS